jgi:hypothetical protein
LDFFSARLGGAASDRDASQLILQTFLEPIVRNIHDIPEQAGLQNDTRKKTIIGQMEIFWQWERFDRGIDI